MLRDWEETAFADALAGFAIAGNSPATRGRLASRRMAWREADLKRAIAIAKKAGLRSYSVEIAPDGTISIVVGRQHPTRRSGRSARSH